MNNYTFSDDFLDIAYMAIIQSQCQTEKDAEKFSIMCEICKKHGISARKFLNTLTEFDDRIQEMENSNDTD